MIFSLWFAAPGRLDLSTPEIMDDNSHNEKLFQFRNPRVDDWIAYNLPIGAREAVNWGGPESRTRCSLPKSPSAWQNRCEGRLKLATRTRRLPS